MRTGEQTHAGRTDGRHVQARKVRETSAEGERGRCQVRYMRIEERPRRRIKQMKMAVHRKAGVAGNWPAPDQRGGRGEVVLRRGADRG